ncbi:hypothetical protein ACQPZJ_37830 [Actinoplanes sp. CA-054009]
MLVFGLPAGLPDADPLAHPKVTEHLTEVGVIVALMGAGLKIDRPLSRQGWTSIWRLLVIATFGIRGIGSFYYLAYALTHADFPAADLAWAAIGFVVLVSVVVHGVAVTPVMRLLDRAHERTTPWSDAAQPS